MPIASSLDTISPELALVDEELNAYGRQVLADFPHRMAASAPPPPIRGRRRWRLPVVVAGCVFLTTAAILESSFSASGAQTREAAPASVTETVSQEPQPAPESRRLRWRSVSGAAFYNVILWRNGERVLDLWPRTAVVRLPVPRLAPGVYQWFVYPVLQRRKDQRFGTLAAHGTLRI